MACDAPPDVVPYAAQLLRSVAPGGPPATVPRQFVDPRRAAYTLDPQSGVERAAGTQVVDEGGHGLAEGTALLGGKAIQIGGEAAGTW